MENAVYFLKLVVRWATLTVSISLLLLVAAGTTRLPSLRNYLVTFSAFLLATMLAIDPELAEERSRAFETGGTTGRFVAGLCFLATLALSALDVARLHWFHSVPAEARAGSLLLVAASSVLQMWAMVVNPFFSPEIRLQAERGHQLVSCGPYRFLRHPGYLAMLISAPASALAIGSWLALLPASTFCLVILKRVGAEEEFLQKNLAGYRDYVRQVRGCLFPRIAVRRRPYRLSVVTKFELPASDRRWP